MANRTGEPKMPAGLSDQARHEWRRVVGLLRDRRQLDQLDQVPLADYILCWERLCACEADVTARGVLVAGDRGQVKNPSCQLARTYRDALVKWCEQFGMTPVSRARLEMPAAPRPGVNKWDATKPQSNQPPH